MSERLLTPKTQTNRIGTPTGVRAAVARLTLIASALMAGCMHVENMHVQTPEKNSSGDTRAAESDDTVSNATVFKGTIVPSPKDQALVIPEPGQSYDRLVGNGDRVEAGQTLLRYAEEVIERFKSDFESKHAIWENAHEELERLQRLRSATAVSVKELEDARLQDMLSKNSETLSRAKLDQISNVAAPRAGTVSVEANGVIKINGPEREVVTVVPMSVNPQHAEVRIGELPPFPATLVMQEFVGADETSVRVTLKPNVPPGTELPIGSVDVRFTSETQE